MSLRFTEVWAPPLRNVTLHFDDGIVGGLAGPDGSGKGALLRLAAGKLQPERGTVEAPEDALLVETGPQTRAELARARGSQPQVLLLDHALALVDAAAQHQFVQQIRKWQRQGTVALIASHDLPLLERICDVVVALEEGRVIEVGDPGIVLAHYRRQIVEQCLARAGRSPIAPAFRHGDRRAEVSSVEMRGESGAPATSVRSGEMLTVRLQLCFHEPVENPVAGILIRTRVGVSVYGTNTELEQVAIGPRRAGENAVVEFQFPCHLCPQEYTLTVASHDPDGAPHDWLEEALLFSVIDARYTAGVANLRAKVRVCD